MSKFTAVTATFNAATLAPERIIYAYGFRTKEAALDQLEYYFATGEIFEAEGPKIKSYTNKSGLRRFAITLDQPSY